MKHAVINFILKVWLITILIGPALFMVSLSTRGNPFDLNIFIMTIIMGAMFSAPSVAVFYFICKALAKRHIPAKKLKVLLSLVALLITYTPFLIIDDFVWLLNKDMLSQSLFAAYFAVFLTGIWAYQTQPVTDEVSPLAEGGNK